MQLQLVDLKIVQYLMDHDDAQTTLKVYTHYLKSNGVKAASAITKLMDSIPTTNIVEIPKIQTAAEHPDPEQATASNQSTGQAAPSPQKQKAASPDKKARPDTPDLAALKKAV